MLKTKTMNIRVLDQTLEQAEKLQKVLKAPSKSDVIRRTIDLTDLIVEALEKGDKLYLEGHGEKKEILIPGLTNERR